MKVSFKASDQGSSSGLYQGPLRISEPRFGKSDFGGKSKFGTAIALLFKGEQLDENGDVTFEDYIMSVGKGFLPSTDEETPDEAGPYLVVDEGGTGVINNNCAFAVFSASLEKLRGVDIQNANDLDGLCVEIKRRPAPIDGNPGRKVTEVVKVLDAMPWDKPVAKSRVANLPKGVKDNSAHAEGIDKETLLQVMGVVVANADGKGIKLRDLPKAVDTAIRTWSDSSEKRTLLTQKTDILEEITGQNFLTCKQDVFVYEDETVSAAA